MNNEVLKAMKTRRSIRKYKPEQITDEQLDAILEAGTYAATGMGKQSPVIVVVQKPELIAKLSKMNAAVMGSSNESVLRCTDGFDRTRRSGDRNLS